MQAVSRAKQIEAYIQLEACRRAEQLEACRLSAVLTRHGGIQLEAGRGKQLEACKPLAELTL
jgi:hypothetical protein